MTDVDTQLARLTVQFESWQREFGRRMDKQDEQLTLVLREVRETNGRVTRHDGKIESLEKAAVVIKPFNAADDAAKAREEIKWYVASAGGGAGLLYALFKLMGKV